MDHHGIIHKKDKVNASGRIIRFKSDDKYRMGMLLLID